MARGLVQRFSEAGPEPNQGLMAFHTYVCDGVNGISAEGAKGDGRY
jgi:hypothetical protein